MYNINKIKEKYKSKSFDCRKLYVNKFSILNHKKNSLERLNNIEDLLINLRQFIISLIDHGIEFNFEKNFSDKQLYKIEKKNIFEILNVNIDYLRNNFISLINIVNKQNNMLLKAIPNSIVKFNKIKKNYQNLQDKFDYLSRHEDI